MAASAFPGNDRERAALLAALRRACRCAARVSGELCAAHRLLDDEAALKRLIFFRRWHLALRRGEWLNEPNWGGD
jgi:hypothetical protein